ncbi:MAG: hypothetical protein AB1Z67_02285 [Candidatus Limnocylindrales bacterium]
MKVRTSLLGCTIAVSVLSVSPTAAQDGSAVGSGGRVEVPEAGYAVTLPDAWTSVRPQASDVETILEAVGSMDPQLASMVENALGGGSFSISLMGFAPTFPDTFAENCNVVTGATDGLSLEWLAAANMAQMEALEWDAELTMDELPAGEVAHIDYSADFGGMVLELSLWLYVDGETQQNLTCTDELRPADSWRSIAETLEFLPAE